MGSTTARRGSQSDSVVARRGRVGRRFPQIEDVVTSDEHLAELARQLAVDELLRLAELEVHVRVDRDEPPLVLHAPLELHEDDLPGEVVQERLRVDDRHRAPVVVAPEAALVAEASRGDGYETRDVDRQPEAV
eukprot:CAMPEP_0185698932 /NCGR_PEP_ID=MMETSP1164-20130828/6621_1 /TAXON_ID=1104430 /ORGANISM="Chrysoreinhardia sp, Strain CCMP2950" /LENGTH=132 /DNA_ID=CAMNT_0028365861 /DNA_START=127 /DNA_END=521 /DNA_ORIENTATION=-